MASKKKAVKTKPERAMNSLAKYRSMRDFERTREPSGKSRNDQSKSERDALLFVVQKHAATRLHYDFRLGWNGVLKSWAVTKGPSYNPADKRLAVRVEDHPWEYRDFEGTIPKGEYGGGTVMVWDAGTWSPHGNVDEGLRDGHLKFELDGTKLKGDWVLVRMHGRAGSGDKENWLLIKEKDGFARSAGEPAVTEEETDSAVTGRKMEEIANGNEREWSSGRQKPTSGKKTIVKRTPRTTLRSKRIDLKGTPRETLPGFILPQLAQQSRSAPSGEGWLHEIKLDGYRIQIHVKRGEKGGRNGRTVRLLSRNGLDWSARMPDICDAARVLNAERAIIDGEAVALDDRGVSSFADLQAAFQEGRQKYITYFAFDLLHLDGHNLRGLPLAHRRRILEQLLRSANADGPLRFSEGIEGDGREIFEKACVLGAEGVVSKRTDVPYQSGRGGSWLKLKCRQEQEFVIGGFTLPAKGTNGVGALLLGYYDGKELCYAGRTGTGFTQTTHRMLRGKLDLIEVNASPFAAVPREMRRGAHWVKPNLVAQVEFATWTRDNVVRQAAYKGLREDKRAKEVVRESLEEAPQAETVRTSTERKGTMREKNMELITKVRKGPVITHPDKVLDEESGMTKQQLADYYEAVADCLLPQISDRPLSIVRCPNGNSKPCFFQKHVGLGLPAGVKSVSIKNPKSGKREDFITVDSEEGLIGLAQLGVLEVHPWGSCNESLERPDRIIFDLDPDVAIQWRALADTAQELRGRLKKLRLNSFVKSTGGKGLHVVVPVHPENEWPVVKEFAHRIVLELERSRPDLYVTKMTKAKRKGRIYLDYLRNDREATAVAAYSPRARQGMPVAMPLKWEELDATKAPSFHVTDFGRWKSRMKNDPWAALLKSKQRLPDQVIGMVSMAYRRTAQESDKSTRLEREALRKGPVGPA